MRKAIAAVLFGAALAACSQDATPAPSGNSSAVEPEPAVAHTSVSGPAPGVALDAINACVFTPAEVSGALGGAYGTGVPVAPIPGAPRRDCTYDEQDGARQLRVNVTWLEPSSAATSRAMMLAMLAGGATPMAGDRDGAIFQDQTDLGTYALHYSRGNLLYEIRLMAFPGGPAMAKEKLTSLRRP